MQGTSIFSLFLSHFMLIYPIIIWFCFSFPSVCFHQRDYLSVFFLVYFPQRVPLTTSRLYLQSCHCTFPSASTSLPISLYPPCSFSPAATARRRSFGSSESYVEAPVRSLSGPERLAGTFSWCSGSVTKGHPLGEAKTSQT